jgi:hypothetical protein
MAILRIGKQELETRNLKPERGKDGETGGPDKRQVERLRWTRDEQERSKVKGPTRKTDVSATLIHLRTLRPAHPPEHSKR